MSGKWQPPRYCGCDKNHYRDEPAALAAAARLGIKYGQGFRVYKCPGADVWHLRTRGFSPASLRSRNRILAWHIAARRVVDREWLYRTLGGEPGSGGARRVGKILSTFERLGLITWDDPHRGYVTMASEEGLNRVMATGLSDYAAEQGRQDVLRP